MRLLDEAILELVIRFYHGLITVLPSFTKITVVWSDIFWPSGEI